MRFLSSSLHMLQHAFVCYVRSPVCTMAGCRPSLGAPVPIPELRRLDAATLDQPASTVLDDTSLAMYVVLRNIPQPRNTILDLRTYHYFRQFPADLHTRAQLCMQIRDELMPSTLAEIFSFFRGMLESEHREDFFEDVYRVILSSMTVDPVPITMLHPHVFAGVLLGARGAGDNAAADALNTSGVSVSSQETIL